MQVAFGACACRGGDHLYQAGLEIEQVLRDDSAERLTDAIASTVIGVTCAARRGHSIGAIPCVGSRPIVGQVAVIVTGN